MKSKKTSTWNWLNPLLWLQQIYTFFASLVTDILKLFGLVPPPATNGFADIQTEDVENAAAGAVEKEAMADALLQQLCPDEIVHAYTLATEDQRAAMDLGKLSAREQDWLLGLSEADLVLLGASGIAACARSLRDCAVVISARRLRSDGIGTSDQDYASRSDDEDREAGNMAYISARFRELMSAPAGTDPYHEPISLSRH